jgi:hypothetical protein
VQGYHKTQSVVIRTATLAGSDCHQLPHQHLRWRTSGLFPQQGHPGEDQEDLQRLLLGQRAISRGLIPPGHLQFADALLPARQLASQSSELRSKPGVRGAELEGRAGSRHQQRAPQLLDFLLHAAGRLSSDLPDGGKGEGEDPTLQRSRLPQPHAARVVLKALPLIDYSLIIIYLPLDAAGSNTRTQDVLPLQQGHLDLRSGSPATGSGHQGQD